MNDNGEKPTGPIRPTAGQDAQGYRQNLSSMLQGILEAKSQVNRQRLAQGEMPMPVGLPISDRDAAMLMATQAVCAHLHHLTVKLEEVRQAITGPPPLAAGADQELRKRTVASDLEEDR